MKSHIFSFSKFKNSFLNEAISVDDWYSKFQNTFGTITLQIAKDIVKADPTSKKGTVKGLYSQWLINLYKKNNLKLEDLYKAEEYLTIFDKVKSKLPNKDISFYKTLPDLFLVVKPYQENKELALSNRELSGKTKVDDEVELFYEDEYIKVEIPLTYRASCALGSGTEWCTATGKTDEYYKNYTKDGQKLYVVFNKDQENKFQFSFEEEQYMDENDEEIEDFSFLENSPVFFQKLKNEEKLPKFVEYLIDHLNTTNLKIIKSILNNEFSQYHLDFFLWYVIYAAIDNPANTSFEVNAKDAITLMDYLIQVGSDVNGTGKWNHGNPILHYFANFTEAIRNDKSMQIFSKFLEYKPIINIIDREYENTPLHICSKNRNIPIGEILLKAGADPNIKNIHGFNSAFIAINYFNPKSHLTCNRYIALLKQYGLNIKDTNKEGLNILEYYVKKLYLGDVKTAEKFTDYIKLKELYNS